ncbi:MAG: MarR family winged helix-turn-helix transcriptional regulator [Miltoncostaeaceae bacterium]
MTERGAELIDRLASVRRATRRAAATGAGLTAAQLDALTYLASCNRFSDTPAAVAEYLATTRGTASQSLLALERKGLLHREPDPLDGRVHHLRPTEAGLDLVGASARADAVADALAALGPDAERLSFWSAACARHSSGEVDAPSARAASAGTSEDARVTAGAVSPGWA